MSCDPVRSPAGLLKHPVQVVSPPRLEVTSSPFESRPFSWLDERPPSKSWLSIENPVVFDELLIPLDPLWIIISSEKGEFESRPILTTSVESLYMVSIYMMSHYMMSR